MIAVVSVVHGNLDRPKAVGLFFHRMHGGIPLIEIAYQADRLSIRCFD